MVGEKLPDESRKHPTHCDHPVDVMMALEIIDAGIGPPAAVGIASCRCVIMAMTIVGLHGWMKIGRCVDLLLTGQLHAHGPVGFCAPTAKLAAQGCEVSSHFSTAFHHIEQSQRISISSSGRSRASLRIGGDEN